MPAVRQLARPTSTNSIGVAPLSSEANSSGWSASYSNCVLWDCSSPRPKKPSTLEWLWVPFTHSHVARHCELRGLRCAAERLAGLEQRGDVDAIVNGRIRHGHCTLLLLRRDDELTPVESARTIEPGPVALAPGRSAHRRQRYSRSPPASTRDPRAGVRGRPVPLLSAPAACQRSRRCTASKWPSAVHSAPSTTATEFLPNDSMVSVTANVAPSTTEYVLRPGSEVRRDEDPLAVGRRGCRFRPLSSQRSGVAATPHVARSTTTPGVEPPQPAKNTLPSRTTLGHSHVDREVQACQPLGGPRVDEHRRGGT